MLIGRTDLCIALRGDERALLLALRRTAAILRRFENRERRRGKRLSASGPPKNRKS